MIRLFGFSRAAFAGLFVFMAALFCAVLSIAEWGAVYDPPRVGYVLALQAPAPLPTAPASSVPSEAYGAARSGRMAPSPG